MTIQWTRRIRAAAVTSLLLWLAACASSRAQFPIQQYVPTTRELLPLGELHLSNTQLQFAALEGQMKLQYVGIMPDSAARHRGSYYIPREERRSFLQEELGKDSVLLEGTAVGRGEQRERSAGVE